MDVTLTIPDLEGSTPEEAAKDFIACLLTGDWSGGLHFEVDGKPVVLSGEEVFSTLEKFGQ